MLHSSNGWRFEDSNKKYRKPLFFYQALTFQSALLLSLFLLAVIRRTQQFFILVALNKSFHR